MNFLLLKQQIQHTNGIFIHKQECFPLIMEISQSARIRVNNSETRTTVALPLNLFLKIDSSLWLVPQLLLIPITSLPQETTFILLEYTSNKTKFIHYILQEHFLDLFNFMKPFYPLQTQIEFWRIIYIFHPDTGLYWNCRLAYHSWR